MEETAECNPPGTAWVCSWGHTGMWASPGRGHPSFHVLFSLKPPDNHCASFLEMISGKTHVEMALVELGGLGLFGSCNQVWVFRLQSDGVLKITNKRKVFDTDKGHNEYEDWKAAMLLRLQRLWPIH